MSKGTVIYTSAFLTALSEGILTLGIIFYMKDIFDAGAGTIGLIGGTWALSYFIGCITFRPLLRAIRPRFSMIISGFLMATSVGLILLSRKVEFTFLFYSFFGLSLSLFWPQAMGWMSHGYEGKDLSRKISMYNLSWISGIIVSPTICGFLSKRNPTLPLYTSISLFILTSLLIIGFSIFVKSIGSDRYRDTQRDDSDISGTRETFLRYPAWVGLFTTYLVLGIITNVFPVYARESLNLDKVTIGNILLARGLATAATFVILGKLDFWHFNRKVLLGGQLFLFMTMVLTIFTEKPLTLALIFSVFGVLFALNYDESVFHGVTGSRKRSTRMAIHEALLTLGIVTGSIAGGFLLENYSMNTVYIFSITVIIITLLIQASMTRMFRT